MKKLPKIARWILSITNRKQNREIILGDFEEFYTETFYEQGFLEAHFWVYKQAFKSIPGFLLTSLYWELIMFRNNLKVIFRNMVNQKAFTIINILGLAFGLVICFLSITFIRYELSYDSYHEKADNIYRVTREYDNPNGYNAHFARCPESWINYLPDEFSEIESLIRFQWTPLVNLKIGENRHKSFKWYYTDSNVFEVFNFSMIEGNPSTALLKPQSVVLTQEMADKYFGTESSIGKEITVIDENTGKHIPYKITGVINNLPANSHFQIEFLVSYPNAEARQGWAWIYLLLNKEIDIDKLESKFPGFIEKHGGEQVAQASSLHLQALKDIHLYSNLDREIEPNGNIQYVYIFGIVAFLVMLIAGFNFINLSTARSVKRSKEVGVRKVLGANRRQLANYFLWESVFFSTIAFCIALLAAIIVFPSFNNLLGNTVSLKFAFHTPVVLGFLLLAIFTGIFSGIYPSMVLSSFNPVSAISGWNKLSKSRKQLNFTMRRFLVVMQFTISIVLIIFTLYSYSQFSFIKNKKLGFNKEQVIAITNISKIDQLQYPVLKGVLENHAGIKGVTASMDVPSRDILDAGFVRVEGVHSGDESTVLGIQPVDDNFIDVMGIDLLAGKNFDKITHSSKPNRVMNLDELKTYISAKDYSYILNETALKELGLNSPEELLGKRLQWSNAAFSQTGRIVGVVKDFHYTSLHSQIRPLILINEPVWLGNILVKVSPANIKSTVNYIEEAWNQVYPDSPMKYDFLDDMFASLYAAEQRQGQLLAIFSALAIFVAYLGLYGLVAYTTEQKAKEIGIRKVMGASIPSIIFSLTKEFAGWILLANLLALPIGFFIVNKWLENFVYRIDINIDLFLLAGALSLLIAFFTICYETFKAARVNPVESIKQA